MLCEGPGSTGRDPRKHAQTLHGAHQLTVVYVAVLASGTVECGGAAVVAGPDAAANQLCPLASAVLER